MQVTVRRWLRRRRAVPRLWLLCMIDVLSDSEMMQAIKQGQDDIKVGRVKELRKLLKEEAFAKNSLE